MRKNNLYIIYPILTFFCFLSLGGCNFESDYDIADKNINQLLEALDNQDRNKIKSIFALSIQTNISSFDDDIDQLFSYYEGEYESYTSNGVGTTFDRNDGIEKKYFDMSYDVTTTINIYRLGIIWYVKDSSQSENIGIWSLYILKYQDDTDQSSAYRSEGENGIHVAKPRLP
ncbi:MAG: DUF5104 domain-containing protein [Bacilli bacterium]|jgi:hypothetical protein|nr:DUF5104 domain-containing protein [Bacilli bacterium]